MYFLPYTVVRSTKDGPNWEAVVQITNDGSDWKVEVQTTKDR